MVKGGDALLKKPEVIGHQVQGHDPGGKHQDRQGDLETPGDVGDVVAIEGVVGDNSLQMVGSLRLIDRIEHIDGKALIEGEADREGKDEPQEGPIVRPADAVVQPIAMVVEIITALVACPTVLCIWPDIALAY